MGFSITSTIGTFVVCLIIIAMIKMLSITLDRFGSKYKIVTNVRFEDNFFSYLSCIYLLFLSIIFSHFFIGPEDSEEFIAARAIIETSKLWPTTDWQYGPLWPYVLYFYSKIFTLDMLGIRYLVSLFVGISGVAIYKIGRFFSPPIGAFFLVILTYKFFEYPPTRTLNYVYLSLLAWTLYFIFGYIYKSNRKLLFSGGVLAGLVFLCRGYEQMVIITFFILFYLILECLISKKESFKISVVNSIIFITPFIIVVISFFLTMILFLDYDIKYIWSYIFPFFDQRMSSLLFVGDTSLTHSNIFIYSLQTLALKINEFINGYHMPLIIFLVPMLVVTYRRMELKTKKALIFIVFIYLAYVARINSQALYYNHLQHAILYVFTITQVIPLVLIKITKKDSLDHLINDFSKYINFVYKNLLSILSLQHRIKTIKTSMVKKYIIYIFAILFISRSQHGGKIINGPIQLFINNKVEMASAYPLKGIYLLKSQFNSNYSSIIDMLKKHYYPGAKVAFFKTGHISLVPYMKKYKNLKYDKNYFHSLNFPILSPNDNSINQLFDISFYDLPDAHRSNRLKVLDKLKDIEPDVFLLCGNNEGRNPLDVNEKSLIKYGPLCKYIKQNYFVRKNIVTKFNYQYKIGEAFNQHIYEIYILERKDYFDRKYKNEDLII